MLWNLTKIFIAVIALAVLLLPMGHTQVPEPLVQNLSTSTQTLRWKNGDQLPGRLLGFSRTAAPGESGTIRWVSPSFLDDLLLDVGVLDSIIFATEPVPATESFRVVSVSGDVWMADIVGSDDRTLLFSSERHGQFRVKRSAIYTLERRGHPNLIFDGSRLTSWKLPKHSADDPIPLLERSRQSDWYADYNGHPRTDKIKARIFYALDWPQRFEIDLEFTSVARPPGFVFALGRDLYGALRLETWENELVVVQDTLFEPILTIRPDQRHFSLRLAYDSDTEVLKVFDAVGNLLLELDEVKPTVKESGLYIYNRDQNLTLRRLRVYQDLTRPTQHPTDFSKSRVQMMNGQILYGKLFVESERAYVLDADGIQHDIDLLQIDRVIQLGAVLTETKPAIALTYPDNAVLRGEIVEVNTESIVLQTGFADEPIACVLSGASLLQLDLRGSQARGQIGNGDRLFYPSGNLWGRISFDEAETSFMKWHPVGGSGAVRLADTRATHIERNSRRAAKMWPYKTGQFNHILHLKNGEVILCQILSSDETTVNFRGPFISGQHMDAAAVKAFEFSRRTRATNSDKARVRKRIDLGELLGAGEIDPIIVEKRRGNWIEVDRKKIRIMGNDAIRVEIGPDGNAGKLFVLEADEPEISGLDVKLERALTVPRFNRDSPPSHILVAKNGDMKRGKLLGFDGKTVRFDSKLRQFSVPITRVERLVEVSVNSDQPSTISRQKEESDSSESSATQSETGFRLTDGSVLIFKPLKVKDGKLFGHSSLYGAVAVPVNSIEKIHFGDTIESFTTAFEKWVVRPAKEPTFADN